MSANFENYRAYTMLGWSIGVTCPTHPTVFSRVLTIVIEKHWKRTPQWLKFSFRQCALTLRQSHLANAKVSNKIFVKSSHQNNFSCNKTLELSDSDRRSCLVKRNNYMGRHFWRDIVSTCVPKRVFDFKKVRNISPGHNFVIVKHWKYDTWHKVCMPPYNMSQTQLPKGITFAA